MEKLFKDLLIGAAAAGLLLFTLDFFEDFEPQPAFAENPPPEPKKKSPLPTRPASPPSEPEVIKGGELNNV